MSDHLQIDSIVDQNDSYVTYLAYDQETGRKCLLRRYLTDNSLGIGKINDWKSKFYRILDHYSSLDIPTLVNIIGGGIDPRDGNPYLVFEWIDHTKLQEVIDRDKKIETSTIDHLTKNSLQGLSHIHQSDLPHGHLNPSRILHTAATNKDTWIIDWDPIIALKSAAGINRITTSDYTSPALIKNKVATPSDDLFALGVILQKTGDHGPLMTQWLSRLTSDSHHAFHSIEDAKAHLYDGHTQRAKRPKRPRPTRARKPGRYKKLLRYSAVSLALLCVASLIIYGAYFITQRRTTPLHQPPLAKELSIKPNQIALAKENVRQLATIHGKILFIDQSQSTKTTYFHFTPDPTTDAGKTIWLEMSTKTVLNDNSIDLIQKKFLGKKVSAKALIHQRNTKIGDRNGYYLKVKDPSSIKVL